MLPDLSASEGNHDVPQWHGLPLMFDRRSNANEADPVGGLVINEGSGEFAGVEPGGGLQVEGGIIVHIAACVGYANAVTSSWGTHRHIQLQAGTSVKIN
jgi:hypothetical protein